MPPPPELGPPPPPGAVGACWLGPVPVFDGCVVCVGVLWLVVVPLGVAPPDPLELPVVDCVVAWPMVAKRPFYGIPCHGIVGGVKSPQYPSLACSM